MKAVCHNRLSGRAHSKDNTRYQKYAHGKQHLAQQSTDLLNELESLVNLTLSFRHYRSKQRQVFIRNDISLN